MALNRNKYDIEVRDDDTIKHDQIFLISCNERSMVWMDYIWMKFYFDRYNKKDQFRKQSAAEVEILNRDKKERNKKKEGTSKPSPKKRLFCE